jgi:hypothetical protein
MRKLGVWIVAICMNIMFGGGPTMASNCDELIRQIDKALTMAKLRPGDAARLRDLRSRGDALRKTGHPEGKCMEPLMEAATLLGLEAPAKR